MEKGPRSHNLYLMGHHRIWLRGSMTGLFVKANIPTKCVRLHGVFCELGLIFGNDSCIGFWEWSFLWWWVFWSYLGG